MNKKIFKGGLRNHDSQICEKTSNSKSACCMPQKVFSDIAILDENNAFYQQLNQLDPSFCINDFSSWATTKQSTPVIADQCTVGLTDFVAPTGKYSENDLRKYLCKVRNP